MKVVHPEGLYEVVTCSESPHFITLSTIYSVGWTEIASQPNWDPAKYETVPPQLRPRPTVRRGEGAGPHSPGTTFSVLEDATTADYEAQGAAHDSRVLSLIFSMSYENIIN